MGAQGASMGGGDTAHGPRYCSMLRPGVSCGQLSRDLGASMQTCRQARRAPDTAKCSSFWMAALLEVPQ